MPLSWNREFRFCPLQFNNNHWHLLILIPGSKGSLTHLNHMFFSISCFFGCCTVLSPDSLGFGCQVVAGGFQDSKKSQYHQMLSFSGQAVRFWRSSFKPEHVEPGYSGITHVGWLVTSQVTEFPEEVGFYRRYIG